MEATIKDYARMCDYYSERNACTKCPTFSLCVEDYPPNRDADKINEIILKWVKEHPIKTRQDRFLEMFPNVGKDINGVIEIAPCAIEKGERITNGEPCWVARGFNNCTECREEYWLAEVEE